MKIVLDTNTVISGLFWKGAPRQILDLARDGSISLITSPQLLAELGNVLGRDKFSERLTLAQVTVDELVFGYAALARVIRPKPIKPAIKADPEDDKVLACAKSSKAEVIVSGDRHLLALEEFEGIRIASADHLLAELK
jgi:putative PIN family toxin of toxin-antitoxin system